MQLEAMKHGDSSFITLTFAQTDGPARPCKICKDKCRTCDCKEHGPSLQPQDARNFLKRLRKILEPQKIRYFLVGEYGEETQKPHFHAIIFGLSPYIAGGLDGYSGVVRKAWQCGHTFVGTATPDSMQYVSGYVVKKLTNQQDERLNGRHPEFARMSNGGGRNVYMRGGIGAPAVNDIARAVDTPVGLRELIDSGDVPASLQIGSKSIPLARYLRRKTREALGMAPEAPQNAQRTYALKMQNMFIEGMKNPKLKNGCKTRQEFWKRLNYQKALNLGSKYRAFEAVHKI